MKVGYLGVPGSNSEVALQNECKNIPDVEAIGYATFPELIADLANKKLSTAIIPVENSTTGFITRTADLFRSQPIVAVSDRYEPINYMLFGIPGSKLEDITEIYSHPEALSQCEKFLSHHPHIKAQAYGDTAKSAAHVHEQNQPYMAAIANPRAGKLYGLEPIATNIQTEESNTTRFYIMKHTDDIVLQGNQLSLYLEVRHEPGALSKLLQIFGILNCNLLSLNARPIPGKPFAYGFFLELDMSHMAVSFEVLWQTVLQAVNQIQILGQFERRNDKEYNN
ncbi:prephenate dehydratase [Jeotgalibaca sp. A122]|uniref:prephenate dehydratase n=1 Tax=Jeotgalibaca sp. A122 TaxID=3457322 RepID=UPI003FD407AA